MAKVVEYDAYFEQKKGFFGLSNIQKSIPTLGMFAYANNKYCSLWENMIMESMKHFVVAICVFFHDEYLQGLIT
jgi:hypothetical protein